MGITLTLCNADLKGFKTISCQRTNYIHDMQLGLIAWVAWEQLLSQCIWLPRLPSCVYYKEFGGHTYPTIPVLSPAPYHTPPYKPLPHSLPHLPPLLLTTPPPTPPYHTSPLLLTTPLPHSSLPHLPLTPPYHTSPSLLLTTPPPHSYCPLRTHKHHELVQKVVHGPEVRSPVGVAQTSLERKQARDNLPQLSLRDRRRWGMGHHSQWIRSGDGYHGYLVCKGSKGDSKHGHYKDAKL